MIIYIFLYYTLLEIKSLTVNYHYIIYKSHTNNLA